MGNGVEGSESVARQEGSNDRPSATNHTGAQFLFFPTGVLGLLLTIVHSLEFVFRLERLAPLQQPCLFSLAFRSNEGGRISLYTLNPHGRPGNAVASANIQHVP